MTRIGGRNQFQQPEGICQGKLKHAPPRRHASIIFPTTLIKAVKGTRDLLPPSTEVWNQVEAVAREVFRTYNYHEIRTPILEETQLFARGLDSGPPGHVFFQGYGYVAQTASG